MLRPSTRSPLHQHSLVIFLGATLPIPPMSPVSTKRHDKCRRNKLFCTSSLSVEEWNVFIVIRDVQYPTGSL
ncbi:MAG TPA: hypothetical protein V6C90_15005 [Coleofasciculaceae cyanobacterium]